MRHNIARDIALATKLVILWTGISVYTLIPVNRNVHRIIKDIELIHHINTEYKGF